MNVQRVTAAAAPLPAPAPTAAAVPASYLPETGLLTTTQVENLDLATLVGLLPTSTALLQTQFPAAAVDNTLLDAGMDMSLARALGATGLPPALPGTGTLTTTQIETLDLVALEGLWPSTTTLLQSGSTAAGSDTTILQAAIDNGLALVPTALSTTETATQLTLAALPRGGPTLATLLEAGVSGAVATSGALQAASELQASAAAAQQAAATSLQTAATDLEAEDLVAQATMVLQARQALEATTQAGSGDIASLLSGLPAGATATLMGGGWAIVPPGADRMGAQWSFQFPFAGIDIPPVTSSTRTDPTGGQHHQPAETARHLTTYGLNGREQDASGESRAPTFDLLD